MTRTLEQCDSDIANREHTGIVKIIQYSLPPPGTICNRRCLFVCLSVCLPVSNFAQNKLLNGFAWNFQGRLEMGQWTTL